MKTLFPAVHSVGTTALSVARADARAWGNTVQGAAHTIALVAATCFVAGEALGRWVHQLNADLAATYRCLLVGAHRAEAAAEVVIEQVAATWQGLPIQCFSVVELRTLARERGIKAVGDRRVAQARRADLLLALA
jgi:hypothetical protein